MPGESGRSLASSRSSRDPYPAFPLVLSAAHCIPRAHGHKRLPRWRCSLGSELTRSLDASAGREVKQGPAAEGFLPIWQLWSQTPTCVETDRGLIWRWTGSPCVARPTPERMRRSSSLLHPHPQRLATERRPMLGMRTRTCVTVCEDI